MSLVASTALDDLRSVVERLNEVEPEQEARAKLQSQIWSCIGAGYLWRGVVVDISDNIMDIDLRELSEPYGKIAQLTAVVCEATLRVAEKTPGLQGMDEIKLMAHETSRLIEWIGSWPSWDATNRDAARKSTEPFMTEEELLAWSEGTT